jgi:hypothetical protein
MHESSWAPLVSLAWLVFVVVIWFFYRDVLHELLSLLSLRIKSGASLKIANVEFGPVAFASPGGSIPDGSHTHQAQRSMEVTIDDGSRKSERDQIYSNSSKLFLAHRLKKSENPSYAFDVTIYLITHKDGSLLGVNSVDYYFGPFWKNQVFRVNSRYNSFAVETSAYGPFLCTASATLVDGTVVKLNRYIDFEMGNLAVSALPSSKQG